MKRPLLYGPTGKPLMSNLYASPRYNLKRYKPRYNLARTTQQNVNAYDRSELVNYSRQLRSQVDVLGTAVEQKNSWAFGDAWDPHYMGRNVAWGEEAEAFLRNQFYPLANVRGRQYGLKRSLRLSGEAWDTDGDDLMVLTESPAGFPQIAFFPSTRIGNGPDVGPDGIVKGGQYDGAKIFDGIIMDRNARMIAVRVLDENGETYTDISSFSGDLAYEPNWHDQGRGIPRIAVSLLRWMNVQDIDDFLQAGVKRASQVGLMHKVAGGEAAMGNEIITEEETTADGTQAGAQAATDSPKIYYEEHRDGEVYYVDSITGEGIEGIKYENPHPNVEEFIKRIERGGLASVGWAYELIDLSSTGRAPTRLLCRLGNQSIWDRQSTGVLRAFRAVGYAIAKAMKNGFLSRNDDGMDPYSWEFGLPAVLSVDEGNDEQADRENLKMGTTSKTIIAQKKGFHRKEIQKHRKIEIIENSVTAAEIEKETAGRVTFDKAMELLEQRYANPAPAPKQTPPGPPTK